MLILEWQVGTLKDDDFQKYLFTNVNSIEPDLAKLMHILFKRNVQGYNIEPSEYHRAVENVESNPQPKSNLTCYIYGHKDFKSYINTDSKMSKKKTSLL